MIPGNAAVSAALPIQQNKPVAETAAIPGQKMANLRALVKRRKAVRNIGRSRRRWNSSPRRGSSALKCDRGWAFTPDHRDHRGPEQERRRRVTPLLVSAGEEVAVARDHGQPRMCGGYNGSILARRWGDPQVQGGGLPFDLEAAGKRGMAFLRFQGIPRTQEYSQFEDKPTFAEVALIASRFIELFISGQIDEVKVAYMKFINAARQEVTVETLLPMSSLALETRKPGGGAEPAPVASRVNYEFLPAAAEILEELVPTALKVRLFKCFLDAAVSEQIARRVAMKAATENAGDLIKDITRVYNRTRQANITKEISELIAGAEALK